MKFDLRRPCKHCPFRCDIDPYLSQERAAEIVHALFNLDQTFPCHETTEPVGDEESCEMVATSESQHCAGAMILMEKNGYANQMMRIGERLGGYDASKLEMDSPVFENPDDFIEAQEE